MQCTTSWSTHVHIPLLQSSTQRQPLSTQHTHHHVFCGRRVSQDSLVPTFFKRQNVPFGSSMFLFDNFVISNNLMYLGDLLGGGSNWDFRKGWGSEWTTWGLFEDQLGSGLESCCKPHSFPVWFAPALLRFSKNYPAANGLLKVVMYTLFSCMRQKRLWWVWVSFLHLHVQQNFLPVWESAFRLLGWATPMHACMCLAGVWGVSPFLPCACCKWLHVQ